MKVECAMQNEQTDGLVINHSFTPLLEQERMQTLDAEEMESSSKIDSRDVSWWMSIKEACILRALVIAKFSKERCISLAAGGKPSHATCKHD
jgi:hypothetical protein